MRVTEDKLENVPLSTPGFPGSGKRPKTGIKYLLQARAYSSKQPLRGGPCAPQIPELAETHPISPLGPSGLPVKAGPGSFPAVISQRYSLDRDACRLMQTQAELEGPWSAMTGCFHPLRLRPTLAEPGSGCAECGGLAELKAGE